jgi:hemerythrin-like domain-containing protein
MTAPATVPSTRTPQLRLPGQAAAPEGPVDLFMFFVMHAGFRRDLAAFDRAVATAPVEDRARWRALAQRWQLFADVLHQHHTHEDDHIWPHLLQAVDAAGDTGGRAVLEAMEAEHGHIDPLLAACARGFARLAQTADDDARRALQASVAATREHLGTHLAHEETSALALVQRYLTQPEWDALEAQDSGDRPSFGQLLALVGWVLHELPAPAVARLRTLPKARLLLVVARLGATRRFRRLERAAFPAG